MLCSLWCWVLTVVKAYLIFETFMFCKRMIWALYVHKLAPLVGLNFDYSKVKGWTLITGCTDGIGKAMAFEIAKLGKKLILVSRNSEKLSALAKELRKAHNVETKVFQFDFTSTNYSPIIEFCEDLEIDVLINNVGMAPPVMKDFLDSTPTFNEQLVNVNILSVVRMTEILMPKMVSRNFGAVVNISSTQAYHPVYYLATYGATKAFIAYLSDCLYKTYPNKGSRVKISCFTPNIVATNMTRFEEPPWYALTASEYAKDAVKAIGSVSTTTGALLHDIQMAFVFTLPWWLVEIVFEPIYAIENRRLKAIAAKGN